VSAPFTRLSPRVRLLSAGSGHSRARIDVRDPLDTTPVDVDTRIFVWQRDGGRCRQCGARSQLHFDHVIPRSWGGASTADNVQILCRRCNLQKGASLLDDRASVR
jgi:HNH endonuclease